MLFSIVENHAKKSDAVYGIPVTMRAHLYQCPFIMIIFTVIPYVGGSFSLLHYVF